ncbi:MAG TPA: hypothetical protein VMW47_05315 [Verrucomicrobiae bacterium]|nr:hypothetical protein [Verrucomicrobiae bacterium]
MSSTRDRHWVAGLVAFAVFMVALGPAQGSIWGPHWLAAPFGLLALGAFVVSWRSWAGRWPWRR